MGILDELLGGGQRRRYSDFVNQYEQGHPSEGYSDQEVLERYRDISHARSHRTSTPRPPRKLWRSSRRRSGRRSCGCSRNEPRPVGSRFRAGWRRNPVI